MNPRTSFFGSFGDCFTYLRKRAGCKTQKDFANRVHRDAATINRIERNKEIPHPEDVLATYIVPLTPPPPLTQTDILAIRRLVEHAAVIHNVSLEGLEITIIASKGSVTETIVITLCQDDQATTPALDEQTTTTPLDEQTTTTPLDNRAIKETRQYRYLRNWLLVVLVAGILLATGYGYYRRYNQPISALGYYEIGKECYFRKPNPDYPCAINNANKALDLDPKYGDAYYLRGSSYWRLLDYNKAIADQTKALDYSTSSTGWAYYVRGISYKETNKKDQAIVDLLRAYDLASPGDPDLLRQLSAVALCALDGTVIKYPYVPDKSP